MIVDDHPLFRAGLKSLLEKHSVFEIAGEAKNGNKGVKKAKNLKPDLVIMNLSLPDQSGIEITRTIRNILPDTRIMMLSMHSNINYITEAFRAGALGYVVKESATERLVECLRAVSKGEYYLDAALSFKVVENLMKTDGKQTKITDDGYNSLTPREREVTRLLTEG